MNELITSILTLAGLGAALALLLVIAERYLANYGEVTIRVNDDRDLKAQGGASLLSTLMTKKIFIPSACGGRGTCAYCKVKVKEGGGPVLPVEEPYLTPAERADGVRLSCQVKVRNDMQIEIPEELFAIRQYRATVERITDLTYDIKELRLKLIEPTSIKFKSGQYVQLETPVYEKNKEPCYRAYSISTAPSESGVVELIVRLVPNGICTTWVFQYLKEGQEVRFSGPYGEFKIRPTDRKIVFVAGGSGFAPIKAMIQGQAEEINRRTARFFFGARALKDLFHVEFMKKIREKYPNIEFIPALSMPDPEDKWEGETGLITAILDRHLADASNTEFYLCGSPGMIDACVKVIHGKGVGNDLIFFDKF